MKRKKINLILVAVIIGILFIFISSIDVKLKANNFEIGFHDFEKDYLNIMENYTSSNDGQIVFSSKDGLYERNGCYMIDGNSFSRLTGASIINSEDNTSIRYEEKNISIKNDVIYSENDTVEILPQAMEYSNGSCAFPIQTVAAALGYKVNVTGSEEKNVTLTREFSTKRLIVKYKGNLDSCGAIASAEGYDDLHIFQYKDEESTASAYEYFKKLSFIEYVECDEVVTVEQTDTESTDASISSTYKSWGAEAMGVGNYTSHIKSTMSTLPEIIVAVIDTGIDTDHEWFKNRIAAGGKDFTASTSKTNYEYEDDQGHGTHVSGIIVDLTLDNVKILPIKVMDESGKGYTSSITLGVKYVTSLKKTGVNIRALNMSLGGTATSESNKLYSECITEADDNGILAVVAAGNENTNVSYVTPANVSCAVTVAAVANANNIYYRPYYSNFGSYVDVCAPGSAILSARMGGGTVTQSGTSMAAPHVAAAAALVLTEHSEYTHKQVEKLLKNTAIDLGDKGKDSYYGMGMVNLRYIYAELLSGVTFSNLVTNCTQPFDLTISHTNSNAVIYYTVDGTLPTPENGILYTSPIRISRSVKIRASAYVLTANQVDSYSNPVDITYRFGNQDLEDCFIVDNETGGLVYYQGILEDVTVPQIIDGTTITTICSGAFTATNVVNVVLPNSVIEIQSSAFRDCKNLQTVTAPNVKSIGNYAFQSCSKLMYVNDEYFPELIKIGAYAFYQCSSLRSITLSKVETIDSSAFYMRNTDPKYLTSINLPSVKIISDFAFNYASYVTQVNLPKVEIISECAFQENDIRTLYLPNVIYLGSSAFFGNDKMTSADLPKAVYLATYALAGSTEGGGSLLSSVNLPKAKVLGTYVISHTLVTHIDLPSVETLLPLAFYTQRLLESFTAPNLKYVGSRAFGYCEALTEANLPSVISLDNAFYACKNLQTITLSPCLEKMPAYSTNDRGEINALKYVPETCVIYYYKGTAFEDFYKTTGIKNPIINLSNDEAFTYIVVDGEVHITGLNGAAPAKLVIPSYIDDKPVTKICEGAFEGCISSIKLNVLYLKEIEENAFKGCINLTDVYLTRINIIGAYAFANCSNLKNLTIESVNEIGAYAFNGCTNLKVVTLPDCLNNIGDKALGFDANWLISDFVIYANEDTFAHTYALENGIEFQTIFENIKGFYYDTYMNENTGKEEIVISLVETYTTGNIIIPESYKGMTISKIGDEAFSSCLATGVILPSTITTIGIKAFSNCHFLESINLDNILTVGQNAFYGCQSLKYVNMPLVEKIPWSVFGCCSSLKIADLSGVIELGQDAFNECYSLEKVICPNLVTLDAAFKETTSLKSVDTKNVVTIIGNAFVYSKSLEELYFPKLETISSGGLFSGCPSLKKVVIGRNFKSYVVDMVLDMVDWAYYNVPIYGYSGSLAEEWALSCVNYNNTKHWDFTAIDEMDELSLTKDLSNKEEIELNNKLTLSVAAEGVGLSYQWYLTEDDISTGTPIKGATDSQLVVDTTVGGAYKYYVIITDWKDDSITSSVCEVDIMLDKLSIEVTLGEYTHSFQNGKNEVNVGESFLITFTSDLGYHISEVIVDGVSLTSQELEEAIFNGYTFTNVSGSHTIQILSSPNKNTIYRVYHYKQSLEATSYEIDGKYYELEIEDLTGTTGTLTKATGRAYEGFTKDAFEQKNINGSGNTIVSIFYNLNRYTITLIESEGVTAEGNGSYLYGESVTIKAIVDEGYEWVEWESSNAQICPNVDSKEYTFSMPSEDLILTAKVTKIQPGTVLIKVASSMNITSSQNGTNQVNVGDTYNVSFSADIGYHITDVKVDDISLTNDELNESLLNGYTFTNVTESHTIRILSAPNEDTLYKVYHYKQSLDRTSYEINGKYYELEIENLTGTTGTLTTAVGYTYDGYTVDTFNQKSINGSGDTTVSILYNRNTYAITLVGCEGVTVEGSGAYLYGESVTIKALVQDGYDWVEWESSNAQISPNKASLEYTFSMPNQDITLTAKATKIHADSVYIRVESEVHSNSAQSGNNQVNVGNNFVVTFTAELGYHITDVKVDNVSLTNTELKEALLKGYTFTNVTISHTLQIQTAPNKDTHYKVYHYKQSLEETTIKINGKYYELEIEDLIGTTDSLTTAVSHTYEGFTTSAFEQKVIRGNGDTKVSILYTRNSYTITLVGCEGVTVEGSGTYLFGQSVTIKALVNEGYEWVEWASSNPNISPNKDSKEYTFSMPDQSITFTAKANKSSKAEQPEQPEQPTPEAPTKTQEKGFDVSLWLSIGAIIIILIILVILLVLHIKNKTRRH
ncbi:MAG: leucine-rich repeat protein [Anaeroplasmataceae bacterium]|nr:leucine-rich repeat protein [Anaeroplasmataceae bacterium]